MMEFRRRYHFLRLKYEAIVRDFRADMDVTRESHLEFAAQVLSLDSRFRHLNKFVAELVTLKKEQAGKALAVYDRLQMLEREVLDCGPEFGVCLGRPHTQLTFVYEETCHGLLRGYAAYLRGLMDAFDELKRYLPRLDEIVDKLDSDYRDLEELQEILWSIHFGVVAEVGRLSQNWWLKLKGESVDASPLQEQDGAGDGSAGERGGPCL